MTASQARAPSGSMVISIRDVSIDSMRHPARPPVARLLVAEAEHDIATVGFNSGTEASDKARPVAVIEHVEQAAVQDSVVLVASRFEFQRVSDEETRVQVSLLGFLLSQADGPRREVDSGGNEAESGGHQRVLASSTSDIEDAPGHSSR